ncbi:MAG: hypothetical protein WCC04_19300 [Terriglobales bacterium]
MDDAEMDRILSRQDEIQLSSGFAASVMEAVRREAAAPPPIPFPWKRALPLGALAAITLILTVVVSVFAATHPGSGSVAPNLSLSPVHLLSENGLGSALIWTGVALLAAFVSVKFSMRLAGRT